MMKCEKYSQKEVRYHARSTSRKTDAGPSSAQDKSAGKAMREGRRAIAQQLIGQLATEREATKMGMVAHEIAKLGDQKALQELDNYILSTPNHVSKALVDGVVKSQNKEALRRLAKHISQYDIDPSLRTYIVRAIVASKDKEALEELDKHFPKQISTSVGCCEMAQSIMASNDSDAQQRLHLQAINGQNDSNVRIEITRGIVSSNDANARQKLYEYMSDENSDSDICIDIAHGIATSPYSISSGYGSKEKKVLVQRLCSYIPNSRIDGKVLIGIVHAIADHYLTGSKDIEHADVIQELRSHGANEQINPHVRDVIKSYEDDSD